jgi:hypothetical protein
MQKSSYFGVRRQSEAATALLMSCLKEGERMIQNGVALRLPPHTKISLVK